MDSPMAFHDVVSALLGQPVSPTNPFTLLVVHQPVNLPSSVRTRLVNEV